MTEVAIVGGGPAGAYCAYNLAENGIYPVIFDHSHPREKPCGGVISPLAQRIFPFLQNLPIDHIKRKTVCVTTPSGRKFSVNIRKGEVICISRLMFDQFLLNMALNRGVKWVKEKVVDVKQKGKLWKIKTNRDIYTAERLVGADGIKSIVRKKVTLPLKISDKGICYGYFVENLEEENTTFHFLSHRKGYIWIIPRKKNTSIGIGCSEIALSKGLNKELDAFIKKHYPNIKIISKWAALIPNIKEIRTLQTPLAGPTWVLIGDAASHVNPITGEGILYALSSGKLAAEAIKENSMLLFERLWRQVYGLNLSLSIKLRKWIYKKPLLEWYCMYLKIESVIGL